MVVLDTPDPRGLAEFYAQLLGWQLDPGDTSDDWVTVRGEGGTALGFQRAPDLPRPTWPGGDVQQQLHLDLHVHDYAEPEARALALGATVLDAGRDHLGFRVYADPSGHPFCLCLEEPPA
ncbi:VOC family protein [Kineococcus esterisolvens]|uniref:VOC family protein n=1 Tax=unclassified Kineococcus TaxID=2621656 RepID=UPI003D7E8F32